LLLLLFEKTFRGIHAYHRKWRTMIQYRSAERSRSTPKIQPALSRGKVQPRQEPWCDPPTPSADIPFIRIASFPSVGHFCIVDAFSYHSIPDSALRMQDQPSKPILTHDRVPLPVPLCFGGRISRSREYRTVRKHRHDLKRSNHHKTRFLSPVHRCRQSLA